MFILKNNLSPYYLWIEQFVNSFSPAQNRSDFYFSFAGVG